MAKMIEGVTENILKCAKEEFLANGYENASLRNIAEKAGTTKKLLALSVFGQGGVIPQYCPACC